MHFDTLWIFVLGKPDFHSIYYNFQTNCWDHSTFFFQEKQTAFANILSPHTLFLMTHSSCCESKNKNFPKFLVRPCILTPSEYSFWENPIFIQFIITSKQIVGIILLFFSGEADSLCEHFEPSHTVFNDSQFMLWRHQTSSHPPRWNFATGAEVTNPENADICKRRRVKGLEIILIEKAINFI